MVAALSAVAAVALALLILGVPVLVLQAPFVTRALVARHYDPETAGLPLPVALDAAEEVRRYTTDPGARALPERVEGREGFDASAAGHLRDVRDVLVAARRLTLAAAAVFALALALLWQARRPRELARALRAGALGTLAAAAVSAAYALLDFDSFFAAFHALFFAAGTWTFASGTLLIELFPEPVWAAFGGLWALGAVVLVAAALLAARSVRDARSFHVTEDV